MRSASRTAVVRLSRADPREPPVEPESFAQQRELGLELFDVAFERRLVQPRDGLALRDDLPLTDQDIEDVAVARRIELEQAAGLDQHPLGDDLRGNRSDHRPGEGDDEQEAQRAERQPAAQARDLEHLFELLRRGDSIEGDLPVRGGLLRCHDRFLCVPASTLLDARSYS